MPPNISNYLIADTASIRQVTEIVNKNRVGIVLVVDNDGVLLGTITDGDIRRAILAGVDFSGKATKIMCDKPVVARAGVRPEMIRTMMEEYRLHHIPIVDERRRPVELCHVEQFLERPRGFSMAVVMAGGDGERLRPITDSIPKPMVRVGDRPVLEHILRSLVESGVRKFYFSVNYKAEVIDRYFGDGQAFGVAIEYLRESQKLGTAGSLKLLPETPNGPFLVINGDVLTTADFRSLFSFHTSHRSVLTVAAAQYRLQIPYATLKLGNHYLLGVEEKPEIRFHCNAGIYAVDPEVLRFIPEELSSDMTTVIEELLRNGLPVSVFPIYEFWVDIGNPEDLKRARQDLPTSFSGKEKVNKE